VKRGWVRVSVRVERRIACLPGLFGDDFTPSINQPSPLLSLLPLPAPWQRVVWGDSP